MKYVKRKLILIIIFIIILTILGIARLYIINNTNAASVILRSSLRIVYCAVEQYNDIYHELPDSWLSLIKETDIELSAIYPAYPNAYFLGKYSYNPIYYFPQSSALRNTGSRILLATPYPRLGKRGVILFDGKFHLSPPASVEYIEEKDFQNYLKQNGNRWCRP